MFNFAQGSEICQIFYGQNQAIYIRKANAATTTMPGWVRIHDTNSIPDSGWKSINSGGWVGQYRKFGPVVYLTIRSPVLTSNRWITCPVKLASGFIPTPRQGETSSGSNATFFPAYSNGAIGDHVCVGNIKADGTIQVAKYGGDSTYVDFTVTYMV